MSLILDAEKAQLYFARINPTSHAAPMPFAMCLKDLKVMQLDCHGNDMAS